MFMGQAQLYRAINTSFWRSRSMSRSLSSVGKFHQSAMIDEASLTQNKRKPRAQGEAKLSTRETQARVKV